MTVASKKNTQVWSITGSSRGLGRALAEAVLAAGHRLVATARNPEQLAELVERHGNRVRAVALDVTDERASIAGFRRPWMLSGASTSLRTTPVTATWRR